LFVKQCLSDIGQSERTIPKNIDGTIYAVIQILFLIGCFFPLAQAMTSFKTFVRKAKFWVTMFARTNMEPHLNAKFKEGGLTVKTCSFVMMLDENVR